MPSLVHSSDVIEQEKCILRIGDDDVRFEEILYMLNRPGEFFYSKLKLVG